MCTVVVGSEGSGTLDPVLPLNDEIDSMKTDTFGPFLQGNSPDSPPDSMGSDKFLDEITFAGQEYQIKKLLYLEFRDTVRLTIIIVTSVASSSRYSSIDTR